MADSTDKVDFVVLSEAAEAEADKFREKLITLLEEYQGMGPVLHICIIAQLLGSVVVSNVPDRVAQLKKTVMMNFDQGVQTTILGLLGMSEEESKH